MALILVGVIGALATGVWYFGGRTGTEKDAGESRGIGEVHDDLKIPVDAKKGPAVEANREACVAFLREQVRGLDPAKAEGGMVLVYPWVQADALEALTLIESLPVDDDINRMLSGDGDPDNWDEVRLRAAALKAKGGHADGLATLRAFLDSTDALEDADLQVEAARAARWLPAADAAGILRRLLVDLDVHDEDTLAEVLRAVATVGEGASQEELSRLLADADEDWGAVTQGAAAGALLRMGDRSGEAKVNLIIEEDDGFDGEEFALGLGARGNGAVLPWLEKFLQTEDEFSREAAAHAMRIIGDKQALDTLKAHAQDDDKDVRWAVGLAMAALGDASGLPLVRECISYSKDVDVRIEAWRILGDYRDAEVRETAATLLAAHVSDSKLKGYSLLERIWAARLVAVLDTP
jgi:HEAT repeat protein